MLQDVPKVVGGRVHSDCARNLASCRQAFTVGPEAAFDVNTVAHCSAVTILFHGLGLGACYVTKIVDMTPTGPWCRETSTSLMCKPHITRIISIILESLMELTSDLSWPTNPQTTCLN